MPATVPAPAKTAANAVRITSGRAEICNPQKSTTGLGHLPDRRPEGDENGSLYEAADQPPGIEGLDSPLFQQSRGFPCQALGTIPETSP